MSNVPGELKQTLKEQYSRLKTLHRLYHLSIRGISILQRRGTQAEAHFKVEEIIAEIGEEDFDSESADKVVEEARVEAAMATEEVQSGFPLLHEQVAVSLWSWLENLIRTVAAQWIDVVPEALAIPEVANLRFKFGDYEALDPEEKRYFIVEQLEKNLAIPLRGGVTRFEKLLNLFGLSGEVAEDTRKSLWELSHIRHVIVHRGSIADKRFVEACPWAGFEIGDRVIVSDESFSRFYEAAMDYAFMTVTKRIISHFEDEEEGTSDS
jgi:hypothetical protein